LPARLRYYTDPACSASWAAEPLLRRLQVEFGEDLQITYVMGGLARQYEGDPASMVIEWLDDSARSGMPVDPRAWGGGGAIGSSFPACMAVKAAAEQGPEAAASYLRALREGILCHRRRLDRAEALREEARRVGLDAERFRIDLESHAIVEAFGSDLEETRSPPEPARERGLVREGTHGSKVEGLVLPALRFMPGEEGAPEHWRAGDDPYEDWRAAALAAGASPVGEPRPDVLGALGRFGSLATPEVEAVCDLPGPRARAELWRLAADWRVRAERILTGELWVTV
jgi:predicted DsbA family dithiol-disulfide isomerase